MDLNEIKAGTYLLVAPFWEEYLSKPGQPFDFKKHKRGAVLELNVENARRLVVAGAVIAYDPAAPTHVVNADGSVSEIPKPDPAAAALVITQDQMDQLGLPADTTSEEVVQALQNLQQVADAARQQAVENAEQAIAEAQAIARDAEARAVAAEAAAEAARAPDRPKSDRIEDILEWVGNDPQKATTALEGERSTKGDKARPNLVGPLEEIITAPAGDQGGGA